VLFDDKASILIKLEPATEENKKKWRSAVDGIRTSRGTNTYDGLLSGLRMAYSGGRRACVMLFTDGNPTAGEFTEPDDIVREITQEEKELKAGSPKSQVDFHTFRISSYEDCTAFLRDLTGNFANYHNVDSGTNLETAFAHVVSNAINQVAQNIIVTITPSPADRVQITQALKFGQKYEGNSLIITVQALADQQSRHILLELSVPPAKEKKKYEELLRVNISYNNVITERQEMGDEYLYVARTPHWNEQNLGVIEQHNRVKVASKLKRASKYVEANSRDDAMRELKKAEDIIEKSVTKARSLSVCIKNELAKLIQNLATNLDTVKMPLEESLESHWEEKGGWSSCYLTHREDTMISVVRSNMTVVYNQLMGKSTDSNTSTERGTP
jgi:hypothetical protein